MTAVVGIDVGTSGTRALVCDERGTLLGSGSAGYPLASPHAGWAEQNPRDWWAATGAAVRRALEQAGSPPVAGVGLTGQMHGTVLIDERLQPLRPALLWCDARAAGAAEAIVEQAGFQRTIALAGNPPHSGFTAPQLRWLAEHDPDTLARARWAVCAKDYVRAQLTGAVAADHSDASGTGLYGVAEEGWSGELAALAGVDVRLLPPILESGACAGTVTDAAARVTGLPAGVPVAAGAADNAASAFGSGVTRPGRLIVSVGTSGTLLAPVAAPAADPTGACHLFRHAEPGSWYLMAVALNAGGALGWWQQASGTPLDELAQAAAAVAPGSDGVVALPYLSGRRMPRNQPHARATVTGLTLAHGAGHVARALIEGAAYALADGLACLRAAGVAAREAIVTGGATRHRIWQEALTLALPELTLLRAPVDEGAARGAALLGLQAAGLAIDPTAFPPAEQPLLDDTGALTPAAYSAVADGLARFRALSDDALLTAPGKRTP